MPLYAVMVKQIWDFVKERGLQEEWESSPPTYGKRILSLSPIGYLNKPCFFIPMAHNRRTLYC